MDRYGIVIKASLTGNSMNQPAHLYGFLVRLGMWKTLVKIHALARFWEKSVNSLVHYS